ncbi:hypothetical protein AZE42_11764 [Rhizopogon vesiculosus]|uniref:Uncharacterized protein n=1 Tax=Rhizopogon vesiculosus TaxID=180088 RepID=A0A1J8QI78_9AGAM|nr:hypothetical protein AZE42_11764 [Rhizopogon vesiculosus]
MSLRPSLDPCRAHTCSMRAASSTSDIGRSCHGIPPSFAFGVPALDCGHIPQPSSTYEAEAMTMFENNVSKWNHASSAKLILFTIDEFFRHADRIYIPPGGLLGIIPDCTIHI